MAKETRLTELANVEPELRTPLVELLEPGEQPLMCVRTEWNMVWLNVITPLRVAVVRAYRLTSRLRLGKGTIEMPLVFRLPLTEIQKVETQRDEGYDLFQVAIYGEGEDRMEAVFITREDALLFENELKRAVEKKREENTPPAGSTAARLKELEGLLLSGLVSETEYQAKRREILDRL